METPGYQLRFSTTSANLDLTSPASKARDVPAILRNSDNCILRIAKGSAPVPRLTFNSNRLFLFVFHLIGLLDLLADQHLSLLHCTNNDPSLPSFLYRRCGLLHELLPDPPAHLLSTPLRRSILRVDPSLWFLLRFSEHLDTNRTPLVTLLTTSSSFRT